MHKPTKPSLTDLFLSIALFASVGQSTSVLAASADQQPVRITVEAGAPGPQINPAMWGIFFEDINFGADGGLYAELVKNRSFEFPEPLMGWSPIGGQTGAGSRQIRDDAPFDIANPHYLRLAWSDAGAVGIANEGFRGMGFHGESAYTFSAQVRSAAGGQTALRVELVDPNGKLLASGRLRGLKQQWEKRTLNLRPKATELKGRLNIFIEGKGSVDIDLVSLFPAKTWKQRAGGLRADMSQMLADLRPGFMRFPGGCIVEGSQLDRRYQWKNTIGPIAGRRLLINRWNYEFKHRPAPDYFQSFGLGFFEFFQLCEDIGAEPLPILNCGMACQFNTGELVPLDSLNPFIQDALDLIEFANGEATTTWGAKRAAQGHPAPFHLKLLGVGNEQWGPQYVDRLTRFTKALKEKHPEIHLISSAGPSPADDRFNFLWPKLRELHADIVDEHCYANPIWFLANTHRYDHYDRTGPKVFMGEYAAQSVAVVSPNNKNDLECALAEAAFMTGLERNADVVRMASYAPLFSHVGGWQWTPDLIWADNLRVYGTPSYYVQQLFSRNRGDFVLPVTLEGVEIPATPAGRIGVGTFQTYAQFKDVRVTRGTEKLFQDDFADAPTAGKQWSHEGGVWGVKAGALDQMDMKVAGWSFAGEPTWTDYTLALKARKINGQEGFLIVVRDTGTGSRIQWNLGGWTNKMHGLQAMLGGQEQLLAQIPGSIETDRWYDIRLELKGTSVACYLDGQLVQQADIPAPQVERLYASAARDQKRGEVIVKVVNPSSAAIPAEINLRGVAKVDPQGRALVLTSTNAQAVNSLDEPRKVAPIEIPTKVPGAQFTRNFPPYSMTVLKIQAR